MQFFTDGGFPMYLILTSGLLSLGFGLRGAATDRSRIFAPGALITLACSVFGMAIGLAAVSAQAVNFPAPADAVRIGLGELSNNGLLGGILALVLGVAAAVTWPRKVAA